MWPWAHAAVGYLLYTLFLRVAAGERPAGLAVVALGVGTQLPDLVDKTFAWYLGVLPYGRSLSHSVFAGTVLVAVVVAVLRRRGAARSGTAFAIGFYSHLLGDAFGPLVTGDVAALAFLVWPLLPIPDEDEELVGLLAHLRSVEAEPLFLFGLGLTALALALWARHGYPGLAELWGLLRSGATRLVT